MYVLTAVGIQYAAQNKLTSKSNHNDLKKYTWPTFVLSIMVYGSQTVKSFTLFQ
jgi:hypothetical protein